MDQWRRLSSCWRQNNQMMNDECDKVIIYRDELQYCFIVYVCTSTKESANWLCPACVWLTHWVLSMVCLWLVVTWLGSPVVSNVTDTPLTPLTPLLTPVRVGAGAGGLRPGWPGQLRASGRGRVSHQSGSGQRRSLMSHVSHRGCPEILSSLNVDIWHALSKTKYNFEQNIWCRFWEVDKESWLRLIILFWVTSDNF